MSHNGSSQWSRRCSPCCKQGPMKATIPLSSLTRENSVTERVAAVTGVPSYGSNSPDLSPTLLWKCSSALSPQQSCRIRSPGAGTPTFKGRCAGREEEEGEVVGGGGGGGRRSGGGGRRGDASMMRRAASVDAIFVHVTGDITTRAPHPHGHLHTYTTHLYQMDRSTQTEEDCLAETKKINRLEQSTDDKFDKYMKQSIRGWSSGCIGGTVSMCGELIYTHTHSGCASVRSHRLRSSIEGLNQEIEKLVLRSPSSSSLSLALDNKSGVLSTPEGHRAPLAELLRRQTRSVNTQTPAPTYTSNHLTHTPTPTLTPTPYSSGSLSRESNCCVVNSNLRPPSDTEGGVGGGEESSSSPDDEQNHEEGEGRGCGASPRINRFLAREPPDGCERVNLKFIHTHINRKGVIDPLQMDYPLKPSVNFELKPSLGSAFQPLTSTHLPTNLQTNTTTPDQ